LTMPRKQSQTVNQCMIKRLLINSRCMDHDWASPNELDLGMFWSDYWYSVSHVNSLVCLSPVEDSCLAQLYMA
jgi:hypothetical protein